MKTKLCLIFLLSIITISCSKDSVESSGTKVEYQVTATSYSGLTVAYNNENEQFVSGSYQSGWKYSFTTSKKPFTTSLYAQSVYNNQGKTTCSVKILVNGAVVKSETISGDITAQITTQYVIQ